MWVSLYAVVVLGAAGMLAIHLENPEIATDIMSHPTTSLRPVDWADHMLAGANISGVYEIYPFICLPHSIAGRQVHVCKTSAGVMRHGDRRSSTASNRRIWTSASLKEAVEDDSQLQESQEDDGELHALWQGPLALKMVLQNVPSSNLKIWCGLPRLYIPPGLPLADVRAVLLPQSSWHPWYLSSGEQSGYQAVHAVSPEGVDTLVSRLSASKNPPTHTHLPHHIIPMLTQRFCTVHVYQADLHVCRSLRHLLEHGNDITAESTACYFLAGWVA
ncbi:hypothetical protein O3P69_015432 [Scylla paramamosain]|uniref:Uncharacterized protein n=1 Tax=Scylla paramamosain TaxID=85552 RepID=A0AAW0T5U1_SCYPA